MCGGACAVVQAESGKGRGGRGKANAVHKFYLLGDSLVDTSHGLVKGAAYRSEQKRIPLLVACAAGELAAARFLVEVDAPPSP